MEKRTVIDFIDYMRVQNKVVKKTREIKRRYSGKTINNYTDYLRALFNDLKEREVILNNPFSGIKKETVIPSKKNIAYQDSQISLIKSYLIKHELQLWQYAQFIFYSYVRPEELRQLQIQHIHVDKMKLEIPARISKTKKQGFRRLLKAC